MKRRRPRYEYFLSATYPVQTPHDGRLNRIVKRRPIAGETYKRKRELCWHFIIKKAAQKARRRLRRVKIRGLKVEKLTRYDFEADKIERLDTNG